jgi:hypothetical protein
MAQQQLTGTTNPFAPAAYNGLSGDYPAGFIDVDFTYVYDIVLTLNQQLRDQQVPILNDADFAWRAIILAQFTGAFSVRFSDSQGYYLSNGMILSANFLVGGAPVPFPVSPEIVLPSGGRIGIDITDLSGAGNTIELLFRGVKRYRLPSQ